jgi:hypothetical protein
MNTSNNAKVPNDHEKLSSKYSSNLEASIKRKETKVLKPNEIFIMNTNNNHHYNFLYNANNEKVSSRDQKRVDVSKNYTNNNDSSININLKGRNPVFGISSVIKESSKSRKSSRKSSKNYIKGEDPAIPFPHSQKHHSSKFAANEVDCNTAR